MLPHADVAQLVERQLPKLEVAGSKPVVRSFQHASSLRSEAFSTLALRASLSAFQLTTVRLLPCHITVRNGFERGALACPQAPADKPRSGVLKVPGGDALTSEGR